MRMISGVTLGEFYGDLVSLVHHHGKMVTPRGKENRELRPVTMTTYRWGALKKASVNYRLACAEAMAYVCGWDDVGWLAYFRPGIAQFSDDGKTFYGAYGARMLDQLGRVIDMLREDPDSRQAVIGIWEARDSGVKSKDLPCNTQLLLKVRDAQLNLMVIRRSSDLVWGVPYDHHCFWALAHTIANCLNIHVNALNEVIDSLHVYSPSAGFYDADRIDEARRGEHCDVPHPWPVFRTLSLYRQHFASVRAQVEGQEPLTDPLALWLRKVT